MHNVRHTRTRRLRRIQLIYIIYTHSPPFSFGTRIWLDIYARMDTPASGEDTAPSTQCGSDLSGKVEQLSLTDSDSSTRASSPKQSTKSLTCPPTTHPMAFDVIFGIATTVPVASKPKAAFVQPDNPKWRAQRDGSIYGFKRFHTANQGTVGGSHE
jgi:hypothetical protein